LRLLYGVIRREKSMEKRLVNHEKTPVAVWENAWCSMEKRLVHHGIAKDANKDKGKGLLTL